MTILVTGPTGHVGRQIVAHLLQTGQQVRALTRNPATANLPAQVEVVAGDLAAPETLPSALEGVTGLHLITLDFAEDTLGGDDFSGLQARPEVVELAAAAGVRRVTVLRGGEKGPVEQAVEASDLAWTQLSPQEIMTNMLEWAAESIRTEGVVREPFGGRLSAVVHEADIGAVAAAALLEDGHAGKTYTLTGPEALTPYEMVRTIATMIGRDIRFVELTEQQARERWQERGHSEEVIGYMLAWFRNTPAEGFTVSPAVEQVTGRPPRTFAQWAGEHADAFHSCSPRGARGAGELAVPGAVQQISAAGT